MTENKFVEAIDQVMACLEVYKGEEIVRDEHPLHLAIQRLESLSRPFKDTLGRSQNKLYSPADRYWFHLLWASRSNSRNVPPDKRWFSKDTEQRGSSDPGLALYWAKLLIEELYSQKYDPTYLETLRGEWKSFLERKESLKGK